MAGIFVGSGAGLARGSGNLLGGAGLLGSAVLGRGGESVSINAANGNLLVTQQDEFLAGRGLDIGISRTYNSLAQMSDGDNGDKWQMGTVRRVVNLTGSLNSAGSTIQRLGDDGALITYAYGTRDGVSAYWTTDGEGAHDKLVKSGTTWIWTDGSSQITETYSEYPAGSGAWRITRQTDTDNYSLTFSYVGTSDLLDKVTTANGEWVQYIWSGTNITQTVTGYTDLATATAKTLTRTWYDYTAGRLTQVRVDLTPEDNASPTAAHSYWTQYAYEASGRLIQVKQKDGSQADIAYDASGRVATLTQQVGPSDTRVTSLTYGAGFTSITGPDGQITRLDYDAAQRLTKITAPPAHTGAAAQVVQFAWDADGNVISATDAAGKVTSYVYDADGNLTKITDPNLNTVERWYDAGNRVTRELTYGSSAAAASVAQNTRYAYDIEGHLRYAVSAEGRVTEYRYTAAGQLQYAIEYPEHPYIVAATLIDEATMDAWRNAITDRSSTKITVYGYDARGGQIWLLNYGYATVAGDVSTAEGYSRVYTSYDQAGRLLSRYNQGETSETFVYDGLGRLTASTNTTAGTTTIVFNDAALTTTITTAAGFTTISSFNKAGDLIGETRSGSFDLNGSTSYLSDKNGHLRVATDATGAKSFYLYDKAGRKIADVNAYGHVVEYRYDANNRIIATTRYYNILSAANLASLEDPNTGLEIAAIRPAAHASDIWSWTVYDAAGRAVQAIDGDGGVASFAYDPANRLVKTTSFFNKVAVASLKTTLPLAAVVVTAHAKDTVNRTFYDREGRQIGALDGEGFLSEIIYDKAGQKVEEVAYNTRAAASYWPDGTFDQLRSIVAPTSILNRRTRYVYDGQGQLRYAIDGAGGVIGYSYNVAGKLLKTTAYAAAINTTDFTYDNVKALAVANATNDRASTINYNGQGLIASIVDAGGLTTNYTYDSSGRTVKTVAGSGGSARTTYNYYTASGDLRFSVDPEGFVRRFDYDAEGRKTREVVWDAAIAVTDATTIGQVSTLTVGTWTDTRFEYDPVGRVTSSYDGMGNRTHYSYYATGKLAGIYHAYGTNDQSLTYHGYDGAGRLVAEYFGYGEPEQTVVTYAYDGLGNRTSVTDARGKVTNFTYDEVGRVLTATDPAAGVTSFIYNGFGEIIQETDARGAETTNIYDNLGQLARTTDASAVATDYSYTPFGELASVTRAGTTTSFQYDKLGRITRETDALGHYEAYTYDALGNRITSRNKLGGTTTYVYDRRGLLTSQIAPVSSYYRDGTLISSTVTTSFAYDARGNRTQMVEAAGLAEARTTGYVYDKTNRLIETIGQTFLGMTPHSYIRYDARGNVTSTVDPAGARAVNYYDDLNRVVVSIDPVGTYTANSYDKNGNVTATRVYATAASIPADGGSEEEAPAVPAGTYRETSFAYDNLNRLTSSSLAGIKTGYFNGSSWVAATTAMTVSYEYDAVGNVVKATDANGNVIWNYYDALGRKTAQVDGEGYRTDWTYDADGDVTSERRYWNKAAAASSTTVPPAVTADANRDRVTNFTYDLVGNRLSEARTGVEVHNGSGGYSVVTATISYLYNGLGQVTRKTEATGDQINYTYDVSGRLTVEARQAFVDQSGVSVTPTVDYYYNGVGDLSRTRQRGSANAAERVTTYGYNGGKLYWMGDAEVQDGDIKNGLTTYYWYDIAGRQTHTYYTRYDSTGAMTKGISGLAASYEGVLTAYDAAGRVTQKWQATYDANGWTDNGPRAVTAYTAFGEVASVTVGGVTQQQNQYDDAGRLVGTNSGDGIWKYFGYDKNGNQTVAIASAGANLSGKTFDQALALIVQSDVIPTYTVYDKRNMELTVTETGRQLIVGGVAQTLTTSRTYTAFGEVASETNALNATINYTYNNMGRLIKSESPTVSITLENGTTASVRPSEQYYYDAGGRLVATRDANGNLTRQTLLAGSGYGDSQSLVTMETHADGGTKQFKFDIHGDARELVDELGHRTLQTFDGKGRITIRQELRNATNGNDDFIDYYAYDGVGQQLKHWNNAIQTPIYGEPVWVEDPYYPPYGPPYYEPEIPIEGGGNGHWETPIIGYTPDVETTDYDIQGRAIIQRAFGGDVTLTSYVWEAGMATTGLGTFGGWSQTTTMANSLYSIEKNDLFGRATYKRDLGGHVTGYSYDVAGRLASSSLGGLTTSFTWLNSGFLGKMATGSANAGSQSGSWTRDTASYSYDKIGNRLTEQLVKEAGYYTPGYTYYHNPYEPDWMPESYYETSELVKNATASYDALSRLKTWIEAGTAKSPAASVANEYDAVGNVRRTLSTYRALDANGVASTTAATRDYWFRYDSMNRVVVNQGMLEGGVINRGMNSIYVANGGGQDIAYNVAGQRTSVAITNSYINGYTGYTANEVKEIYVYDDAGRLIETREATGTAVVGDIGINPAIPAATGTGVRRSSYMYDLMGRQILQQDYQANGTTVVFSRSAAYNEKGQLTSDYTSNLKTDNKTYTSSTTYNYGYGTGYMLGAVVSQSSSNGVTGQSTTYSSTTNTYLWFDGAVQSTISYKPNTSQSTTYTTSFGYNGMGQLVSAYINDGKPHSATFTNDELGQIIRRDESVVNGQTGAPHEVWYRFAGRQFGYTGNNGTNDMSMAASIEDRRVVSPTNQGTFRNKQMYGGSYADFAQNYDPINSFAQGSAGGSYSVQRGDTLQSIAQSVWGDSSLWYKIAEANGLSAASGLIEGQRLTLPTGVIRSANNASTMNPYDPSKAVGDLSPTTAPKPKSNSKKCGGFGMILLAVIAIAVATVVTAGAASALTGASFGNALGAVFSGSLVGFGTSTTVLTTVGAIGAAAAGAVAGSIVSQAVGVATGIQEKFNWKGVALAGIGAIVGGGIGGIFGKAGNAWSAGAQAAAGSAITQGIGVATGLQDKFSWAGVAAAGVGAALSTAASDAVTGRKIFGQWIYDGSVAQYAVSSAASMIGNAATRTAIDGSSFGKNLMDALPDVLAGILQRAIGKALPGADVAAEVTRNPTQEAVAIVGTWEGAAKLAPEELRWTALTLDDISFNVEVDPAELEVAATEPEFQADVIEVAQARAGSGADVREASIRIVGRMGGPEAARMASTALSFVPAPGPEIIVWGERQPNVLGRSAEYLNYAVGFLVGTHDAVEWVNKKIEDEVPFAWLALEALDFAAGPAAYAARKIVMASPMGQVIDDRIGDLVRWSADKMRDAGIDPTRAAKAASGVAFLGGLAFGATRALRFFNQAKFALGLRFGDPVGPSRPRAPTEARSGPDGGPTMTLPNSTRGWRVGDPINNLTANGSIPSWSAVRARYWKNYAAQDPGGWSAANVDRMRRGLAPQRLNPRTREIESMELNHVPAQRDGGRFDVERVWPDEHAARDPYRHVRK